MKPGDMVTVLVNDEPFSTEIDSTGTQRFVENGALSYLLESGKLDLNDLSLAFRRGEFELDDYLRFYMDLGYSVSGFEEMFGEFSSHHRKTGEFVEVINPVEIRQERAEQWRDT